MQNEIKQQNIIYKQAQDEYFKNQSPENKDEYEFQKQVDLQNQDMLRNMERERETYMKELDVEKIKEYKNNITTIQQQLKTKSPSHPASDFDDLYKQLDKDAHESPLTSTTSTNSTSSSTSTDNHTENISLHYTDTNNGKRVQNLLWTIIILIIILIMINIIIPLITKNKYIPSIIISLLNVVILIISFILLYFLLLGEKIDNNDNNNTVKAKIYFMTFICYVIGVLGLITFSICGIPNIKILLKK